MDLAHPFRAISSAVDSDVLEVLARGHVTLTGREVHRAIGSRSYDGVRLALDRLVGQGVVYREQVGRAHAFTLNFDHLAADAIQQLAHMRLELLRRIRADCDGWAIPPVVAALFGSIATRSGSSESDIDLLVVRPRGCAHDDHEWNHQTSRLAHAINSWTGNDVRILELGEDELDAPGNASVLTEIARDGIELYGTLATIRRATGGSP